VNFAPPICTGPGLAALNPADPVAAIDFEIRKTRADKQLSGAVPDYYLAGLV
jgi:hypothetical protein